MIEHGYVVVLACMFVWKRRELSFWMITDPNWINAGD